MTRGPAKVSVRVDGDDADAAAEEALRIYDMMIGRVAVIEAQVEGNEAT